MAGHPHFQAFSTENLFNYILDGGPVLRLLYDSSIKGTELDSIARHPPPRCRLGFHKSAIKRISEWAAFPEAKWRLLWVYGFAGVGKTAIAQTIGEIAKETLILGAAFFFSHLRNQNNPTRVFVSIAYQLATVSSQYQHAVAGQIAADPGLLQKGMRTQFQKLLIEPLSQLKLDKELLIIVDGLDECRGYDEQREIIHLIQGAASSPVALPVIWMICSRPEYHIKSTFSNADSEIDCWREEIRVDDSVAFTDVELFIRDRFLEIAKNYSILPEEGESWPTAKDLGKINSAVSDVFVFANTVVRFVENPYVMDPESQLRDIVSFIDDPPANPATTNPLYYLDKLYEKILSELQPASLQHALQLLGTCAFFPYRSLPILQLANLYGLNKNRFYAILRMLYCMVDLPQPEKASQDSLRFCHASFFDFLTDPVRSGKFALDRDKIHAKFAKACFGVLGQTKLQYTESLAWKPIAGDMPAFLVAHHVLTYCADMVWLACVELHDVGDASLFETIVNFSYPFLRFIEDKIPAALFQKWSEWLMKQVGLDHHEAVLSTKVALLRYDYTTFEISSGLWIGGMITAERPLDQALQMVTAIVRFVLLRSVSNPTV